MLSHSNSRVKSWLKKSTRQPWDPSVKALTQFPSVLENMDKNLSWSSSLGEAYVNQAAGCHRCGANPASAARSAGYLNSNEQEKVTSQGSTIVIEPANPEVVYVPAYDPWLVYGALLSPTPSGIPCPDFLGRHRTLVRSWIRDRILWGIWVGLGHWGYDWHGRRVPSSIITPMPHIAVSSVTRASITVIFGRSGPSRGDSMGLLAFKGAGAFTLSQVHAPRVQWLRSRRQCPKLFLSRAVEFWRWLPWRWFPWCGGGRHR